MPPHQYGKARPQLWASLLSFTELPVGMAKEIQNCNARASDGSPSNFAQNGWICWILEWGLLFLFLFASWCVLAAIPGCVRPAAGVGSVWMDGLKIGRGVLVGVQDGERMHMAFLTARHVATANGFFRSTSKSADGRRSKTYKGKTILVSGRGE